MTITVLPQKTGEFWWGGVINEGHLMPFGDRPHTRDLRLTDDNQASPLLISNLGRYIWCEEPFAFSFNESSLTIDHKQKLCLEDGHETLQGAYQHASKNHFPPSGVTPDKLAFTAPQYCTWVEMFYEPTQEKLLNYAKSIIQNGMPPGVLIIDDNWMQDYGTWDFDKHRFPDPARMIKSLHELGFKIMLWVCPYVSPDSIKFRQLLELGILMKHADGAPVLRRWWNGYSAIVDYTSTEGPAWFRQQLDRLIEDYGVDGFKLDAGEPLLPDLMDDITKEVAWSHPVRPMEDCESYARLGIGYALSELRMCWKLGGQALIQRQRDKTHTWNATTGLRGLIPNAIAQGLMGYAYNCPDMVGGGMDGDINSPDFRFDAELFIRFVQCSALFPVMQFSMAPWRVLNGAELSWCMDAVRIRSELGPLLSGLASQAAEDGLPILRSLEFVFPHQGFHKVQDQFMVGETILVAPVMNKGQTARRIQFPDGQWLGDDGSIVEGPAQVEVNAPLSRLPWYRKI
ncbi:alpha-glucosidase (family GH31 glycosyl hydrolase) [Paenibacillus sp. PastF-3]|uniref:glycoside hydrolase family 31 protein n=1 Tax=Paenibacillus sp. PastF-3 TaxID=2940626 RepID=UPI0024758C58|nr:glycoside hydrolase family 31 protein [Paenibacillus sp. PastF-3]MDH6369970.1 alpha-glucosidase (family GH31 glycosyl hydrolase) [Paenibacillus sp. PastF-3]